MAEASNPVTVSCVHCGFTHRPGRDTGFKPWCPAHPLGVMVASAPRSAGTSSHRSARELAHEAHG